MMYKYFITLFFLKINIIVLSTLTLLIAVSEVAKPVSEVHQDAKDISPPSVFVNSEPIREDQVQNAVKFLSHPKVKGSPVMYRRSFLERKGLTKEEIDEAFRRVPVYFVYAP